MKNLKQKMSACVQHEYQNTQKVDMNAFNDKTMCKFSEDICFKQQKDKQLFYKQTMKEMK